jgi:hypothetical protein
MTDFNTPTTRVLVHREDEEIWESCVQGRTWVEITDHKGAPKSVSVLGEGQRLRIGTADRLRNQEVCRDPNLDPFTNGALMRVDKDGQDDPSTQSKQTHTEADLKLVFTLEEDAFREYVSELNELNVRRLKALAPDHATVWQDKHLAEQLVARWPIGGDTPTYREMMGEQN